MNYQHIENLLIRFRGQSVTIKTGSGGTYEGSISDVTNDYVSLRVKKEDEDEGIVVVLLHSIESISPQTN
jgi:hypothetical protein